MSKTYFCIQNNLTGKVYDQSGGWSDLNETAVIWNQLEIAEQYLYGAIRSVDDVAGQYSVVKVLEETTYHTVQVTNHDRLPGIINGLSDEQVAALTACGLVLPERMIAERNDFAAQRVPLTWTTIDDVSYDMDSIYNHMISLEKGTGSKLIPELKECIRGDQKFAEELATLEFQLDYDDDIYIASQRCSDGYFSSVETKQQALCLFIRLREEFHDETNVWEK